MSKKVEFGSHLLFFYIGILILIEGIAKFNFIVELYSTKKNYWIIVYHSQLINDTKLN